MKTLGLIIVLLSGIVFFFCDKNDYEFTEVSDIPGQGYYGNIIEYKFLGIIVDPGKLFWIDKWGASSCSTAYHGRIQLDPQDSDNQRVYDANVTALDGKRYLIKIDAEGWYFPTEIEVKLNGDRVTTYSDRTEYFDIIETDIYRESECNPRWNESSGNYFRFSKSDIIFQFQIQSTTGDSLIWTYFGRKFVKRSEI